MIPLRDSQPSQSTPVITVLLIAANVLVFLYEFSLDAYSLNHLLYSFGMVPDRLVPTTIFSSMFLHGGWMHLIGNMWFLKIYGDNIEDILGHAKYFLFYVACGAAAAAAHLAFNLDSRVPTVGASGAIAGVMGAYMVKFPKSKILTLVPLLVFFTTIEVPAVLVLVYWFILQVFSGFGSVGHTMASQGGVAWFAHVGGFVAGVVLVHLLGTRERYRRRPDLRW